MQVKKDEVRDKLLASACKEFMSHGYSGASLRAIADNAGLSKGAIYPYFKNKDELFYELAAPALEYIELSLGADNDNPSIYRYGLSLQGYAVKSFRRFASHVAENAESFRLLLFHTAGSSLENFKEYVIQLYSKSFSRIYPILSGADTGESAAVSEIFVHTLASVYVGMMEELILHEPEKDELEVYVTQMALFVSSGLRAIHEASSKE